LRRCTRVRLSSLRCFFFAIRLRRFLITEPTANPLPAGLAPARYFWRARGPAGVKRSPRSLGPAGGVWAAVSGGRSRRGLCVGQPRVSASPVYRPAAVSASRLR
jgi:hypothetical protein